MNWPKNDTLSRGWKTPNNGRSPSPNCPNTCSLCPPRQKICPMTNDKWHMTNDKLHARNESTNASHSFVICHWSFATSSAPRRQKRVYEQDQGPARDPC